VIISESLSGNQDTWIHEADPRVKMLFVAAFWAVLLINDNPVILLGVLLFLHLLYGLAGIPGSSILAIWKALLPISLLIPTLWAFFYPGGTPLWDSGWITFSIPGFLYGLMIAGRLVALALTVLLFLYTTGVDEMVLGLVKLRVPYEWGLVISMALHYIPAFQSLYRSILEAQQARGLRVEGNGLHRAKVMMPVFVAMVISILRLADQLAKSLESRAFGASGIQRTFLKEIRFGFADYVYAALIAAISFSLLYLNFNLK